MSRISAEAYAIELVYGEKIPECRVCGGHDFERYAMSMTLECRDCGRIEAEELALFVPKDERVREQLG